MPLNKKPKKQLDVDVLLAIFGIVFSAVCVWLTVRIVNRRERWTKRTLGAVLASPMLYVASFGPACWLASRVDFGWWHVSVFYRPITVAMLGNEKINAAMKSYSGFGAAPSWYWAKQADLLGDTLYWVQSVSHVGGNPP